MFWLGIAPKEILSCLFNPFILDRRLVAPNVVMVDTDMCGKSPSRGSGYMELHKNMQF